MLRRMSFLHFFLEGQMKIWLLSEWKCLVQSEVARTNFVYSGSVQILLFEDDSSSAYRLVSLCSLPSQPIFRFWVFLVCRAWFRIGEACTSYTITSSFFKASTISVALCPLTLLASPYCFKDDKCRRGF